MGDFSCAYLTKWTDLIKSSLNYQWPLWGTCEIPKLNFLKTKLENSVRIDEAEWNAYYQWHIEASKEDHESEVGFLRNKVLRLTGC